ncbi:MAG: nucleotidyltransferase family protein [Thermodesulfovibrionales bacterium]|nr:nucleotidyltransferase family protein [Thermodesulfovibrionales bacterium]
MITDCLILAGGIGSRLREIVRDVPKPMADIGGKPFLEYILSYLITQGIKRCVLAVGYNHEVIIRHFGSQYKSLQIDYSIEHEPLGTGGAVVNALDRLPEEFFLFNGDTFFALELCKMYESFREATPDIMIALKKVNNSDRFGLVDIDTKGQIISFSEKSFEKEGLINGGVYIVSKESVINLHLSKTFSWEIDLLQRFYKELRLWGYIADGYFIDIGIPEDYYIAQRELPKLVSIDG